MLVAQKMHNLMRDGRKKEKEGQTSESLETYLVIFS